MTLFVSQFFHTALHTAAREGFDTVVDTLLTRGANKDAIDEVSTSHRSTTSSLFLPVVFQNFHTPLYRAAKGGHHSCVEVLLKKKASLSIADNVSIAPSLVHAIHCYENDTDCVHM